MWSVTACSETREKNVDSATAGWRILQISRRSSGSTALIKFSIHFLIFSPLARSVIEKRMLKSLSLWLCLFLLAVLSFFDSGILKCY